MTDLDRRLARIFALVDLPIAIFLSWVFALAATEGVLRIPGLDLSSAMPGLQRSVGSFMVYTLIPLSACLIALSVVVLLNRSARATAYCAFGVVACGMLLLGCTLLAPWGLDDGWGPFILGNGLVLVGVISHSMLGLRLWQTTMTSTA